MELMFITNQPDIARFAEDSGVDIIFIDLEVNGKKERQGHLDTVISGHSMADILPVRKVVHKSKLLVRVNPIFDGSKAEIDGVISYGADIVMLPMFKTPGEVRAFINYVDGRAKTCLLLETPQAVVRLEEILNIPGIDEIYVGLNDLHLGMGLSFMFELLSGGIVDYIANRIKAKGIKFGFGGMSRMFSGTLPAELILSEHIRLGSQMVILSREFHGRAKSLDELNQNIDFPTEIRKIRNMETEFASYDEFKMNENHSRVQQIVNSVVKA